jgi:uncharacterized protein (DUF433 family)
MEANTEERFTTSEAAFLSDLDLKAVNKAIDVGAVTAESARRSGRTLRLVPAGTVVCLRLEEDLSSRIPLSVRRRIYGRVLSGPRIRELREGKMLIVDVGRARGEVAAKLKELRRVRGLVAENPKVVGGEPVFRGTRIPVHLVADMLQDGATLEDIIEGYPHLTPEMVRLAPAYAAAYPRRGRPPVPAWRARPPVRSARYSLDGTEAPPKSAAARASRKRKS